MSSPIATRRPALATAAAYEPTGLYRLHATLASAYAYGVFHRGDENLAITDTAGTRRLLDRLDRLFDQGVLDHQLDLHLRQEINHVFGAPVEFGMALLTAETLRLEHGNALQSELVERFLHVVELERLDDRLD